jgi:putative salt-induced outer membrane protein YdiY
MRNTIHKSGNGSVAFVLILLVSVVQGFGADSVNSLQPAAASNYVLVTNKVVVTNYVVVTNLVQGTNGFSTNGPVAALTNLAPPDLSWVPPEDGFDWIQLKSGEWLKGSIQAMQDKKLDFDSEELDELTFDWSDIRQMRSPHMNEMLLMNKEGIKGPVMITPDMVMVGGAQPRTFPRSELQSVTPGGPNEWDYWSGKLSVGLALRAGNTKSVDYNAQANLQRRTPATRFKVDYLGSISSLNSVENENNQRVNAEFDYWLSHRLYLILPQAEYYSDPFQNIADRATVGSGIGYDIIDRSAMEWDVSLGPVYQKTWFDSVESGQSTTRGQAALAFGTDFDWDITRRIELILQYSGQYTSQEAGDTLQHAVSTLSIELTKRFDLDVSFIWDRIGNPRAESSGVVPQQDDYRLTVGLGVRF